VKKILFGCLVCVLLLSVGSVSAQTGSTRSDMPNNSVITDNVFGLGLSVNLATGSGFAFKHHLPNIPIAYQITGYGWNSGFTAWSIGAEVQYDLFVQPEGRLYAVAGGSRYGYTSKDGKTSLNDPNRLGIGVGFELALNDKFGLAFSLMLTSFLPSGELLPLPGAGAFIYF
jgi:hypothetical protein